MADRNSLEVGDLVKHSGRYALEMLGIIIEITVRSYMSNSEDVIHYRIRWIKPIKYIESTVARNLIKLG